MPKHTFLLVIGLFFINNIQAQKKLFSLPNTYNRFITSDNIIWAAELQDSLSFGESNKLRDKNIYDHLVLEAASAKLDVRKRQDYFETEAFQNSDTSVYYGFKKVQFPNSDIDFLLADSLKTIRLNEILYLENNLLKSKIILAAPLANFATASGVSMGKLEVFFCCKPELALKEKSSLIFIKTFRRKIDTDSFPEFRLLKQSFGMNLPQSLWYGATQDRIQIIDEKYGKVIPKENILSYNDSLKQEEYDNNGKVIGYKMIRSLPIFECCLSNTIEFTQDVYYDLKSNSFYSVIKDCYLFSWTGFNMPYAKRFKIVFKTE
jgi:hypothetical protein